MTVNPNPTVSPLLVVGQLIYIIIYVLANERLMRVFFEKRRTSFYIMIFAYILLFLARFLTQLSYVIDFAFGNLYLTGVMLCIPALFIVASVYKSSFIKRAGVAFFSFTIFEALDSATGIFILATLAYAGVIPMPVSDYWFTVDSIFAALLLFFLTIFARKYFPYVRRTIFDSSAFWAMAIIVSYYSIITALFFQGILSPVMTAYLHTIFLVVGTFLILHLFNKHSKSVEQNLQSVLHTQEKEYYFSQCQLMQESAEQLKAIRHDMKVHLATLQDFAAKGNTEEIKVYLDSLVDGIEKGEVYSDTGNIAFDSIINYKLRNAKNENIKLDLRVAVPPELDVEVVDIVTILGNLLDNSLEAVTKASEKFIKLDIEFIKGGLFAKIENSFNGEIKYSDKNAGDKRQISSLKNGDEHGYGLKNIKQSVEKYNGYMEITHTENTFSAGVFLYVNG